jgi:hypothetical protein
VIPRALIQNPDVLSVDRFEVGDAKKKVIPYRLDDAFADGFGVFTNDGRFGCKIKHDNPRANEREWSNLPAEYDRNKSFFSYCSAEECVS